MMMDDKPDRTEQEQFFNDLELLDRFEKYNQVSKSTHPEWFTFAITVGRTKFMQMFLDAHDIPKDDLTLKERIAYYQLLYEKEK